MPGEAGDQTDQESRSDPCGRAFFSMTVMDVTIHASFLPPRRDVRTNARQRRRGHPGADRAAVRVRDCAFRDPAGNVIRINEVR